MARSRSSSLTVLFVVLMSLAFVVFLVAAGLDGFDGLQSRVFFNRGDAFFEDFFKPLGYVEHFNPYQAEGSRGDMIIPPFGNIMLYPFAKITAGASVYFKYAWTGIFMAWSAIALFYTCCSYHRGARKLRFFAPFVLFVSSVFLFAFERGNTIIATVPFVFFFLRFYQSENAVQKHLAFLSLSIAAGMKIFPAVFGLLLLYEKRYKDAGILLLYGIVIAMSPILLFKGGAASNLLAYLSNLSLHASKFRHRIFPRFGLPYLGQPWYYTYFRALNLLSYVWTAASLVFLPFYQKKWQKHLVLCCIVVMMPVSSALYNAVYLFPMIMMFLSEEKPRPIDYVYTVLFAALLSPYQLPVIANQQANYALTLIWLLLLVEGFLGFLRWRKEKSAMQKPMPVP